MYETWVDEYLPKENQFDSNAPYEGTMFETYGVELDYILNLANSGKLNHIWTLIDGENENSWIVPGYSIVNRLGYFVTDNAWENENIEVDDNEYLTREECIKICFSFWKENGFEFDLNQIKNFYEKESYTVGEAKYIAMDVYTQITGQDELSFEQKDNIHDYYSNL